MTTIDDWGVPDWRKVNAYPEPDELSKKWWRWEFLRRLQEYREDWLAITKRGLRATGCEKYGLMFSMPDPRELRPTPFEFMSDLGMVVTGDSIVRVPYDVRRPLVPQWNFHKEGLKRIQGYLGFDYRLHWDKLPMYLRAIDAREKSGATFQQIGKVLGGYEVYDAANARGREYYNQACIARVRLADVRIEKTPGVWSVFYESDGGEETIHGPEPDTN